MRALQSDWLTKPVIDFEYKSYQLRAWLMEADAAIAAFALFPLESYIKKSSEELSAYLNSFRGLKRSFPGTLQGIDAETLQLHYSAESSSFDSLTEINRIAEWSLGELQQREREIEKLIELLSDQIRLVPVGLLPLYTKEGYLFIPDDFNTAVFEYVVTEVYADEKAAFTNVHTTALGTFPHSLVNTYEALRMNIHREQKKFDVPATYLCERKADLPLEELVLPLAKKQLARIAG